MRLIDADVLKQHIDKLPALPDGNFAGNHSALKALINMQPTIEPSTSCSEIPNSSTDCISRQAAIDAAMRDVSCIRTHEFNAGATRAADRIKQLPSAQPEQVCVANVTLTDEQVKEVVEKAKNAVISVIELEPHWIPCSERLPEDEYVLISKKPSKISGDKWCVTIAIRTADPRSRKIQWRDSGFGVIQDDKVLAWMPLPEPYRGGEE